MLLHTLMITDQSSPKPNKNTHQCIPKILVMKLMIQEKKKVKSGMFHLFIS